HAPGVSRVAAPPDNATAYRCVQPSFPQGNTSRLPATHSSGFSATIPRNALPRPVSARHTSRPRPVARSATRIDQGGAARRGVNGRVRSAAGMRINASWAPSGDHTGSSSSSTLGSRNLSAFVATSYTPTKPWSPRPLTNASFVPSGDQWSDCALPRARTSCSGFALSASGAHQTCPLLRNATRSPFGETVGAWPSPRRRAAPPVAATIQSACSAPAGDDSGFGYSPRPLASPPRT